ncbi:MAG: hypothetical protein PHU46_01390 [Rhodocyclaceae bacterium]|nr:hypothetical protein [Rhodocyclaceae bacterium]
MATEPSPDGSGEGGAVMPCPCAGATITSQTVMTQPPNRARTRLGVGERVRVTYSLGAATWTKAGDGNLSSASGATITFTAPNAAGTTTLTATGGGCSATIAFTIVAPGSVHMTRLHPHQVEHNQTYANVGMLTNIFLAPDDVNFYRVQFLELEIACTADGVYACQNGHGHGPNPNGLGATTQVVSGKGTKMDANDHVYSGCCPTPCAPWVAPQTGREHFAIPWQWRVGAAGAWHTLTTVHQRVHCDATGGLTASKAGAVAHAQVGDATAAA